MRGIVTKTVKSLFVIGMSVQIILGLVWMAANLFSVQNFLETNAYIKASQSFLFDEYIGILYPLLIAGTSVVEKVTHIPYFLLLYLVQVLFALWANCKFLYTVHWDRKKVFSKRNLFGGFFLLTISMVMQFHVAVLPQSFCLSLFMLLLGYCFEVIENKEKIKGPILLKCSLLWLVMAFLQPDYVWLASLPVVIVCILAVIRKEEWKKSLIYLLLTFCIGAGEMGLLASSGNSGKIQNTVGAAMVSRMVWPHFENNYYFWPQEIKEIMSEIEGREISCYSENVKLIFGPLVETHYGKRRANELYWEMSIRCLGDRTKEVVGPIVTDLAAYSCAPISVLRQLKGNGLSFSGSNYDRMHGKTPALKKWYVYYSLYLFWVGLVLFLIKGIVNFFRKDKTLYYRKFVVFCVLNAVVQIVWYTMSGAGMMDYRNVLFTTVIWYGCLLIGYRMYDRKEETI